MQKHGENGLACAKFLESNPRVAKVHIYILTPTLSGFKVLNETKI